MGWNDVVEMSRVAAGRRLPERHRGRTGAVWSIACSRVVTEGPIPTSAAQRFERLVTTTDDGLRIEPLYTPTVPAPPPAASLPGLVPYTRGTQPLGHRDGGWDVRQRVLATDDDGGTALQIRDELERGATSIVLDLTSRTTIDADGLDAALDGVLLDLLTIVIDAGPRWSEASDALAEVWSRRGLDPADARLVAGADPVGMWAATGGGARPRSR